MSRKYSRGTLDVWANGKLVGSWRAPTRGKMQFAYAPDWVQSEEGRPLSLSLPFTLDNLLIEGPPVENYFDNLLPDSDVIRRRLQDSFHTDSRKAFDLLEAIGRDCVGAIQLLPPGEEPEITKIEFKPLSAIEVEQRLLGVVSPTGFGANSDGDEDSFRLSIAGAQEKTALLWHNDQWCAPHGATPTTHIFKLPLGRIGKTQIDMTTSVENEWLCSRILKAYNIPVAQCEIATFGSQKTLVVRRFDRRLHSSGNYWLRLIQEDFCQATGTPPSKKYEEEGGPGIQEIAEILRNSAERDSDLAIFMRAQILFWMLAAIDGHAKNFSIQMLPGGKYMLTPLYDVLSAWPIAGHGKNLIDPHKMRLAMALMGKNRHYKLQEIQRRHFNNTAARIGIGTAEPMIAEIIAATPSVLSQVEKEIPRNFPAHVLNAILQGVTDSSKRLAAMPA